MKPQGRRACGCTCLVPEFLSEEGDTCPTPVLKDMAGAAAEEGIPCSGAQPRAASVPWGEPLLVRTAPEHSL